MLPGPAGANPDNRDITSFSNEYIQSWKQFYPTEALAAGDTGSAFGFENFSLPHVQEWVKFNDRLLDRIKEIQIENLSLDDEIDLRLLKRKIIQEINKWKTDQAHLNSPVLYGSLISGAFTHLLARPLEDRKEMIRAVDERLRGIAGLCDTGISLLTDGPGEGTARTIKTLEASSEFLRDTMPGIVTAYAGNNDEKEDIAVNIKRTADKINDLKTHISAKVLPCAGIPDRLGRLKYARELEIYTGLTITPEELEKISIEEINVVRKMIGETAALFWEETHPEKTGIPSEEECIEHAFRMMESNRVSSSADFLKQFSGLIDRAEIFIYEKNMTSIRDRRSLFTALSPPHFAGAAVGGVYPAGPFNPDAKTLFYLPTVPDDSPQKIRDGFYRSFNTHFNTMIITHEIFPGHYLQLKEGARNPRIIRTVFGDDLFIEGWASLCEQLTLDLGWDGNHTLTRLAHLRKRLENAVRAFVSVQVHCSGWTREQLQDFAVKRGLLPPQFAVNLWQRVIDSPLQLTSYFLGFRQFSNTFEKIGKEPGFSIQKFCDRVLRSGSVPLDLLDRYMRDLN